MISVAMTTYNGEKYIKEQIHSILNQTHPVDEIIVCDDCSSDSTEVIVNRIQSENKTKTQIRFIKNESNLGYIKNFYKAISLTKGDIVFLSDQDDIWYETKVETMMKVMNDSKVKVLCSNFDIIDQDGNINDTGYILPDFIKNAESGLNDVKMDTLIYGNIAQGCTYCFTSEVKDLYLQTKCFDIIHDYQIMMIGAILEGAYFLNEKLIKYRIHSSNSVGFSKKKNLKHISIVPKRRKPKVVVFFDRLSNYTHIPHLKKYKIVLYLRIPVLRAVFRRYFIK